jgi:hypothetical protein
LHCSTEEEIATAAAAMVELAVDAPNKSKTCPAVTDALNTYAKQFGNLLFNYLQNPDDPEAASIFEQLCGKFLCVSPEPLVPQQPKDFAKGKEKAPIPQPQQQATTGMEKPVYYFQPARIQTKTFNPQAPASGKGKEKAFIAQPQQQSAETIAQEQPLNLQTASSPKGKGMVVFDQSQLSLSSYMPGQSQKKYTPTAQWLELFSPRIQAFKPKAPAFSFQGQAQDLTKDEENALLDEPAATTSPFFSQNIAWRPSQTATREQPQPVATGVTVCYDININDDMNVRVPNPDAEGGLLLMTEKQDQEA